MLVFLAIMRIIRISVVGRHHAVNARGVSGVGIRVLCPLDPGRDNERW